MNKQELLHYLNKLQWACDELGKVGRDEEAEPFVAKMEKAINEYLTVHSEDPDILLKKALLYDHYEDQVTSIECLEIILKNDPLHVEALILLFMMHMQLCFLPAELYTRLCVFNIDDNKTMAIIEFLKAKYCMIYEDSDGKEYEGFAEKNRLHLEKSISLCDQYVWPFKNLALIYIEQRKLHKAAQCLLQALGNIQHIPADSCPYDLLDVKKYIEREVTGVCLYPHLYHHILALYCNFTLHQPCAGEVCEYQ